ncbi:MAG: T9SS type A sorting domain-containing protein [Paludibacter sp.]|nr:T9SS type A sorting domain-containing protein [Paludibacter sp.]
MNNIKYKIESRKTVFLGLLLIFLSNISVFSNKYQHLIIYGQSLSTGHQSWPSLSTSTVEGNYMLGKQIWVNFGNTNQNTLTPLVANIAATTASLPKTRASMIYGECALVSAANHIQLKTNGQYKYIASSCGVGGKSIEDCSKESTASTLYSYYTNTINYAKTIATNNNYVMKCPAIFWMQGEYNYQEKSSGLTVNSKPTFVKEEYKTLLITLKNNMQSDVMAKYGQTEKPVFITYQAGVQYTTGRYLTIGMAQLEAANENEDVVCAGPVYQMTDRGGHLDSNGYRWYGEMLGKVYYKTQILKENFSPLQPTEISRTNDPKKIQIKFLVPKPPLVLDIFTLSKVKDFGFEIYKDSVKQIITHTDIVGDYVYLTCYENLDLNSTIDVIYAGETVKGHGNLRDSDDYQAFYKYVDLDKRNADQSYFYPRDASETTLRPADEPKDQDRNVIYDQLYPLYNFSVAFFYRIEKNTEQYTVPNFQHATSHIDLFNKNDEISFYQQGLNLILNASYNNHVKVEIFNLSGTLVRLFSDADSLSKVYSLESFEKGIYLAKATINNQTKTIKVYIS